MNVCGVVRSLVDMVFDAVEAVMFAFDDPAERVFGDADRLADTEAEEEVAEPADNYQLYECTQPTCGCHEDSRYAPLPHISTAFPSSSPAPASAGDEHSGGSVPRSDVEPPESLILLTVKDIDDAAYAIWRHAETQDGAIRESWHQLADKFETAANAMK